MERTQAITVVYVGDKWAATVGTLEIFTGRNLLCSDAISVSCEIEYVIKC